MSGSYFDPSWTEKVTVPVKRVGERWEFFYGGDVPVKEGTLGELTINADRITDERFQKQMLKETKVKILEEGATIFIALSDQRVGQSHMYRHSPEVDNSDVPAGTTRFEPVTIGPARRPLKTQQDLNFDNRQGGLWLCLKGLEKSELECSTVVMPEGFSEPTAVSLNHALTLLSKEYETHRISNTGNVYTRCFYQENNGRWYPLVNLRRGVRATSEQALISEVWQKVETALGWRPLVADPRGKNR